jgi:hypothetical protein
MKENARYCIKKRWLPFRLVTGYQDVLFFELRKKGLIKLISFG